MMLYSVVLGAIVIWRGICMQKISRIWKIILSVFVLLISAKFYILRMFGGPLGFAPELSGWILLPVAWFFGVLVFFSGYLVIFEIFYGIVKLIRKLKKSKKPSVFADPRWRIAGLIPVVIIISIGMYEGLKTPEVREYTIEIDGLPENLEGTRIIHLADIHAHAIFSRDKMENLVDIVNGLEGDVIVITGDFVDGRASVRGDDVALLENLSAPLGVYGVPGNHEYYSGYDEWIAFLNAHGVVMLENRHVMLAENFALGGVTDPAAKGKGKVGPDVAAAFDGVPQGAFRLLLAHQPNVAFMAAENGVDLQLSGHTHGGMVWGLDLLVGTFNHGLVFGTHQVKNTIVHISNGTGIWNGFPIRLGHPSEIVVITLKRR